MAAFTLPCVAVLSAWGNFSDLRKSRLYECFRQFPLTAQSDAGEQTRLVNKAFQDILGRGAREAIKTAATQLNTQLQDCAYAWCLELTAQDDHPSQETIAMLTHIAESYEVSEDCRRALQQSIDLRFLLSSQSSVTL